jgi:hypothetical protein
VPYKRRKKDSESGGGPLSPLPVSSPQLVSKKQRLNSTKTSSSSMIPATLTPVSIGKDQGNTNVQWNLVIQHLFNLSPTLVTIKFQSPNFQKIMLFVC